MTVTMIFQIVGNLAVSDTAEVERIFKDDMDISCPSMNVVHAVEIDVDLGSVEQLRSIHRTLKDVAHQLGFKNLLNVDLPPGEEQAVERANKLRRISTEAA